jgi:hypothetical protein
MLRMGWPGRILALLREDGREDWTLWRKVMNDAAVGGQGREIPAEAGEHQAISIEKPVILSAPH